MDSVAPPLFTENIDTDLKQAWSNNANHSVTFHTTAKATSHYYLFFFNMNHTHGM